MRSWIFYSRIMTWCISMILHFISFRKVFFSFLVLIWKTHINHLKLVKRISASLLILHLFSSKSGTKRTVLGWLLIMINQFDCRLKPNIFPSIKLMETSFGLPLACWHVNIEFAGIFFRKHRAVDFGRQYQQKSTKMIHRYIVYTIAIHIHI